MRSLIVFGLAAVSWWCCVVHCYETGAYRRDFTFPAVSASSSGFAGTGLGRARTNNHYLPPDNGLVFPNQHRNFFQNNGYGDNGFNNQGDPFSDRWLCLVAGMCGAWPTPTYGASNKLNVIYEMSQLEYDYPNPQARQTDISSGVFIPGNGAPIDVEVVYSGNGHHQIYVTVPRFVTGIPVTIGTISNTKYNGNNVITPFPDWSWHQQPERCNFNRLVSVFRVEIDECGRLWVLDTGRVGEEFVCPPQILAFDVNTKEVLHRYTIPKTQYESRSIFVTPIVDVRDPGQCRDTFVYAADCQSYSIVVYDVKKDRSWRVTNKLMYPFPTFGTYNIAGEHFELMDGVLGMSLQPFSPNRDRKLFFHSLSSNTENWVYTSVLKNNTVFTDGAGFAAPEEFHVYEKTRPSQSAASAIDRNGIQYFGMIQENSIGCWNTATPYGNRNIHVIQHDDRTLQFASGVKIVNNKKGAQELWVVTSRLQKAFTGTLNSAEINFRILAAKTQDLTKGTKCYVFDTHEGTGGSNGHGHGGNSNKPNGQVNFPPSKTPGHY